MKRKEKPTELEERPKKKSRTENVNEILKDYNEFRYNVSFKNNYLFDPFHSYIPQVKDRVFFITQGYVDYLEKIKENKIDGLLISPYLYPNFESLKKFDEIEECEIFSVKFSNVEPVTGIFITVLKVQLKLKSSNDFFLLHYVETPTYSIRKFLVIRSLWEATEKFYPKLKVGDKVSVYLSVDDRDYNASIHKKSNSVVEYNGVVIKWIYDEADTGDDDDDDELTHVCPWELHTINVNNVKEIQGNYNFFSNNQKMKCVDEISDFVKTISRNPALTVVPKVAYPLSIIVLFNRLISNFYRHSKAFLNDLRHLEIVLESQLIEEKDYSLKENFVNILNEIEKICVPEIDDEDFDLDDALLDNRRARKLRTKKAK